MTAAHNHPPRCCCPTPDEIMHRTRDQAGRPTICPACPEHGELAGDRAPAWAERWHQDGPDSAHERTQCEPDMCGLEPSVAGLVCPKCRQPIGRPHTEFCTLAPGRVWNGVLPASLELDYEPDASRIVAGGTRYDPPARA
jgi:hypothetical protein